MKGVEAQIAGLRASPRARRALEARVWHHLSKRSKRYTGHGRGRGKALDDGSVGSNDSAGSAASNGGPAEGLGQGQGGLFDDGGPAEGFASIGGHRGDASPAHGQGGSQERPPPGKAQALHAQEVLRRKRCVSFARRQTTLKTLWSLLPSSSATEFSLLRFYVERSGFHPVRHCERRLSSERFLCGGGLSQLKQCMNFPHRLPIRAIEEKRSKQARERSAMLADEARRPRDRRAEKKRAEALITIVFCAKGVSREGGAG